MQPLGRAPLRPMDTVPCRRTHSYCGCAAYWMPQPLQQRRSTSSPSVESQSSVQSRPTQRQWLQWDASGQFGPRTRTREACSARGSHAWLSARSHFVARETFISTVLTFLAAGLCHRRQWSEPLYTPYATRSGIKCVVRVNHREYHTDRTYTTEQLATENAAMRAYLICRNFSVNDGKYPSGHPGGRSGDSGVLQGLPVAIGTGRRSGSAGSSGGSVGSGSYTSAGSYMYEEGSEFGSSQGTRSGGSSPGSAEFPVSYRSERRATTNSRQGGSRRR